VKRLSQVELALVLLLWPLADDKVSCEASNAAVDVLHHNNVPLSIESIAVGPPQFYSQDNHIDHIAFAVK
jgi:hypothetical protein